MWSTTATDLTVARNATVRGALAVSGQTTLDGGVRVRGPVELPAGSLDLDDLSPETIGEGMARDGLAMRVDDAWLDDRIRGWVRSHCRVQLGWRDNCDNCDLAPTKDVTVRADGICTDANGLNTRCRANNTRATATMGNSKGFM